MYPRRRKKEAANVTDTRTSGGDIVVFGDQDVVRSYDDHSGIQRRQQSMTVPVV